MPGKQPGSRPAPGTHRRRRRVTGSGPLRPGPMGARPGSCPLAAARARSGRKGSRGDSFRCGERGRMRSVGSLPTAGPARSLPNNGLSCVSNPEKDCGTFRQLLHLRLAACRWPDPAPRASRSLFRELGTRDVSRPLAWRFRRVHGWGRVMMPTYGMCERPIGGLTSLPCRLVGACCGTADRFARGRVGYRAADPIWAACPRCHRTDHGLSSVRTRIGIRATRGRWGGHPYYRRHRLLAGGRTAIRSHLVRLAEAVSAELQPGRRAG